jgi:rare lipoprotein A (peptidoglycan hydrolase)
MRLIVSILIILSTPAYAGGTVATWYGQEHAGKRTASGEVFNPNGLTSAHRSLPVRHLLTRQQSEERSQRFRSHQ